jgi:hypothetical protein
MNGITTVQIGLVMLAGVWLVAAGTSKRMLEWKHNGDAALKWWWSWRRRHGKR